jgi:hypothetical protein
VCLLGVFRDERAAGGVVHSWIDQYGVDDASRVSRAQVGRVGWTDGFSPAEGPTHEDRGGSATAEQELGRLPRGEPSVTFVGVRQGDVAYLMWHEYQADAHVQRFTIGLFHSADDIMDAVRAVAAKPGFVSYPHGFRALVLGLDLDHTVSPLLDWIDD